jgi:hypothetical protein
MDKKRIITVNLTCRTQKENHPGLLFGVSHFTHKTQGERYHTFSKCVLRDSAHCLNGLDVALLQTEFSIKNVYLLLKI